MDSPSRSAERYSLYENLRISYEGFTRDIPVHVPDLSTNGMFINTALCFPEGAVIRVSFLLPRTKTKIDARAEVRYCIPGSGVGLEFVNLEDEKERAIELELSSRLCPYAHCTLNDCNHCMQAE
jgi:hypothetical protein